MNRKTKSQMNEHAWQNVVDSYSHLGSKKLANGTRCIGHVPSRGKYSFLHSIFPVCTKTQINSIEKNCGKIPASYKKFLLNTSNGLELYSSTLSLFGYKNWDKAIDEQPYDIVVPNTYEKPIWLEVEEYVIGSYIWDGTLAVMAETGQVRACEPEAGKILKGWGNMGEFLNSEACRLRVFFRENGEEIDEANCTLPT